MKKLLAVAAAVILFAAVAAADSFTTYTSRSSFGGNDSLDWGQLGPAFTSVASGTTATSVGSVGVTVTDNGGYERRDQGISGGWNGNFSPGDHLLWNMQNGPDTWTFSQGISGIGFNIQDDAFGSFVATFTLSTGDTFSTSGNSNANSDGSAAFWGIFDNSGANITSLTISTGSNDFAVNQLSLYTGAVTPEPASLVLFGSGLLGLGGVIRRRRK